MTSLHVTFAVLVAHVDTTNERHQSAAESKCFPEESAPVGGVTLRIGDMFFFNSISTDLTEILAKAFVSSSFRTLKTS